MTAQRNGRRDATPEDVQRFMARVVVREDGCWQWQGYVDRDGYGKCYSRSNAMLAHRFAYRELRGPIPAGLQLDHLCRNRSCVNPAHLEPVTAKVNAGRRPECVRTHCAQGHALDAENTAVYNRADGRRLVCLKCRRVRNRQTTARRREQQLSARTSA